MWQVGVEGCLARLARPPSRLGEEGKLIVRILRSLGTRDREGARCEQSRIGSSHQGKSLRVGKEAPWESFFTELMPAGVWCLQCCSGKKGPAKMGSGQQGTGAGWTLAGLGTGAALAAHGALALVQAAVWCGRD